MKVTVPKGGNEKVQCPEHLYEIMQKILMRENAIGRNQEHFWVAGLDNASKLLFIELIGLGVSNRVYADSPTIFRMAIYKMAKSVIFVHNHPSGSMKVSDADLDMTIHQYKAGKMLNIDLHDHLIISETKFLSFAAEGLMDKVRESELYTILDKKQQSLREDQLSSQKNIAKQEEAREIAKRLKDEGLDVDIIKKVTGLGKVDIRRL